MGIERLNRVPLLFGLSPVHRLERPSEHLSGAVDIWAKRQDFNSGLAYGGKKARKLEYLAADVLAAATCVVGGDEPLTALTALSLSVTRGELGDPRAPDHAAVLAAPAPPRRGTSMRRLAWYASS